MPHDRGVRLGLSRRSLLALGGAVAALGLLPRLARAATDPQSFMDEVGQQVVRVFQLPANQRLPKLVTILDQSTDLKTVARLVVGRYWRQATPQQQADYTDLFRQFTIVTIASQLNNYGGQTYQITGSHAVDDTDTIVTSKILRPGQQPANVDWRVRKGPDGFKIIDVIGEGVSAVVTWRQEYAEVLQNSGFDALLSRLREQIDARKAQATG